MAGKIKEMIDKIVKEKTGGNPALAGSISAKIIMKGVIVQKYDATSDDDPAVIEKLKTVAQDMGVNL